MSGVKEAAEGDGYLFAEKQAELGNELVLVGYPGFVG